MMLLCGWLCVVPGDPRAPGRRRFYPEGASIRQEVARLPRPGQRCYQHAFGRAYLPAQRLGGQREGMSRGGTCTTTVSSPLGHEAPAGRSFPVEATVSPPSLCRSFRAYVARSRPLLGDGQHLVLEVRLAQVEEAPSRHGRVLHPVLLGHEGQHRLGVEQTGYRVLYAVENDLLAVETLNRARFFPICPRPSPWTSPLSSRGS
jgi:hypothetical protein